MGKIKKILENELIGGTQSTDVYPVTSIKAVYDENNKRLDNILNRLDEKIDNKTSEINVAKEEALQAIAENEQSAITNFNSQRVTPEMLSESTKQLIEASGGGTITNLADDEDITSVDDGTGSNVLKFADRTYNANNFSGKGYKILRKNIKEVTVSKYALTITSGCTANGDITITVNSVENNISVTTDYSTPEQVASLIASSIDGSSLDGAVVSFSTQPTYNFNSTGVQGSVSGTSYTENRNVLTQSMINKPNTIYEIRYDFDLNGQTIVCSNSSKLYFTSGSLNNGKISFNKEINLYGNVKLYENLKINVNSGNESSWNKHIHYPIYISWFIKSNENIRDDNDNIKFDILYYRFYNMFEDLYYNTNANITLIVENDNYVINDNIIVPTGVTIDFQNSDLKFSEKVLNGEYVFNLGIDKDVFDTYKNNFDIPDKTKYKSKGHSGIKTCLKNINILKAYNNLHLILSIISCRLENIKYTYKGSDNILFYQPKGDATYAYLDMFEMYHIDLGTTHNTPLDKLTKVYINIGDAKSIEHISGGNWYIENSQRTIIRHAINCVFNLIDSTVGLYNIHNEFNDNIYINNGVVLIQDSYLMIKGNVDDRNDRSLITLDKRYKDSNSILSNSTSILTLVNTIIGSEVISNQFKGNSRYYIQAINGAEPILNLINSYVVLKSLVIDIPNNITTNRSRYLCNKNTMYIAKNKIKIYRVNDPGFNFNLNVGDSITYTVVSKHYKRNTIYSLYKSTLIIQENKSLAFGWYKESVDLCDFDIYLSFDKANYTKLIKFNNIVGTIGQNYCYIPFNDGEYMFGNKIEDINISFSDFSNNFTNDMICDKYKYNGDDDIVTYICETEANFHHLANECEKQDIIKYTNRQYKFNPSIGKFVSTDKITGTSSERPNLTNLDEGFEYYDTTLKKKIIWNGTTWVNLDGTELS